MNATEDRAVLFNPMSHDVGATGRTSRRHPLDRAFETVERMGHPVHDDLECLVVVVSAGFGCTVTILRDDGRQQPYRIVGEDEADPPRGTISYVSPVARALIGKKIGEVVRAGTSDAEVIEIR